jgi:hypothetical protein
MDDIVWSYRDSEWSRDRDLVGYEVEADGGKIGTVDAASNEASAQWLVVDTGFWILDKKRVIPAGTVVGMDHEARMIVVSMSKDQIKAAPDYDESEWATEDTRAQQRARHGEHYSSYADRREGAERE